MVRAKLRENSDLIDAHRLALHFLTIRVEDCEHNKGACTED